jgi:hypothetical protein
MISFIKKIFWKREMTLFDTGIFILKSFATMFAGYAIFSSHPYLGRDMISLLFGAILTLEPVNVSGLKKGLEQIYASLIGGTVAAVIVMIGGINIITVPLAVSATLYITLRINWKSMSVIAVFTAIYMTQLVQYNAAGEPGMLLTLQLRIISLGTGILIAVAANFVFSLFFYRTMLRKRIVYILEATTDFASRLADIAKNPDLCRMEGLKGEIKKIFVDIDQIGIYVMDIGKNKRKIRLTRKYMTVITKLRDFNHYLLDIAMLGSQNRAGDGDSGCLPEMENKLKALCDVVLQKKKPGELKFKCGSGNRNVVLMKKTMEDIYTVLNAE